jgi:hypothetical protein
MAMKSALVACASSGRMRDELEGISKEAAVACWRYRPALPERTEENHESRCPFRDSNQTRLCNITA